MTAPGSDNPDVLIVGGGIIGTLSALALAKSGLSVTILERGTPLKESSWAGAGILSPIHPWRYPDALSHMVNHSLALYPDLVAELREVSGVDPQHRTCGLVIPVYRAGEWLDLEGAGTWSSRFGWPMERLDGAAAREVEPCLSESVIGALYWPGVGQIRNPRLGRATREAVLRAGVHIRTGEEVVGLESEGDVVTAVRTRGGRFSAGQVLLAAGSWTGGLAEQVGLELPVAPVKGQIVLLKTEPGTLTRIVKHERAYLVPRIDGHILVGATMEMAGFNRSTTVEALHFLSGALLDLTPCLANATVEHHWMGFRPGSPDGLPYLGRAPGRRNLFVAAGHYRNGVILAPATADAVSALMTGEAPPVDLSAFALDRKQVAHAELGFPVA